MEILGDIVILNSKKWLPIAWPLRGFLGLKTGAEVSVGIVASTTGLPDIIITPLKTRLINNSYVVRVIASDKPGLVKTVTGILSKYANIVLSDSSVVAARKSHVLECVVEPSEGNFEFENIKKKIEKKIKQPIPDASVQIEKILNYDNVGAKTNFEQQYYLNVSDGWVKNSDWYEYILKKKTSKELSQYDLNRLIISASTESRLVRFMIPRKKTVMVRVAHNNVRKALSKITAKINDANYNIVSSRLSRIPPREQFAASMSLFVAACEPQINGSNKKASKKILQKKVNSIGSDFMVSMEEPIHGIPAEKTRYIAPRGGRFINPGHQLHAEIAKQKKYAKRKYVKFCEKHADFADLPPLDKDKYTGKNIYISRRFVDGRTNDHNVFDEYSKTLFEIQLAACSLGVGVLDSPPQPDQITTLGAIYPRLWASDGCLVLALDEHRKGKLSNSQSHEYGFFMGQAKSTMVLVESSREGQQTFGNSEGLSRLVYASGNAKFVRSSENSIFAVVRGWINAKFID